MMRDAAILGVALPNISRDELIAIHSAIVAGLENKTLRPIVGQEIPLPEASRAHAAVLQPGSYGKIVLVP
jgi:NADPH2:quinone reductase